MKLTVTLPTPVMVMPSSSHLHRQHLNDEPPSYDATTVNAESSPVGAPLSSLSSTHASMSTSSTSSDSVLRALITLTVPAYEQATHVLTSLTARLKAYESLVHNNGGFQQSQPIDLRVTVPLPSQPLSLLPGKTYSFRAEIVCPDHMPPSVQLPDAKVRYKVCVRAKTVPAVYSHSRLASLLRVTTLTDSVGLTVVQAVAAEPEGDGYHSNIKHVSIEGLGPVCISTAPRSPCIIGASTTVHLSLPEDPPRASRIANVEVHLSQDSTICWRSSSLSKASKSQQKPRFLLKLPTFGAPANLNTASRPAPSTTTSATPGPKANTTSTRTDSYQTEFRIPDQAELQTTTLAGSSSAIHTSHQLFLAVSFFDASNELRLFEYCWPVTLARTEAICPDLSEHLPVYTAADPLRQINAAQPSAS